MRQPLLAAALLSLMPVPGPAQGLTQADLLQPKADA